MEYQEARRFVEQAREKAGEMGLEAIREMLNRLGNPQNKLKIVHVGGTNGKGSISTYIAHALAASGYKVGRYVSPTIRHYLERIQTLEYCDNKPRIENIPKNVYVELVGRAKDVYVQMEEDGCTLPSDFELETVLCFLYCLREGCHVLILEVGMGGRIDATNVVENPLCSVFASISMDHMQVLGASLEEIAKEKAGIMKENSRAVAYDYQSWSRERDMEDKISPVLRKEANRHKLQLSFADFQQIRDEKHQLEGISFSYKQYEKLSTPLLGENQPKNAAVAIEAIEVLKGLGYRITEEKLRLGFASARWEGRFQLVHSKPYVIVDGAHNEDAARSLSKTVDLYLAHKCLACVMGILADKEYHKVLAYMAPKFEKIVTITPDNPRALSGKDLALAAKEYCGQVKEATSVKEAIESLSEDGEYDVILIFGSLYFLHQVYEFFHVK